VAPDAAQTTSGKLCQRAAAGSLMKTLKSFEPHL
jgi:hypothetical protein